MALVLIEGWDHLTAAQTLLKGWSNAPGSIVAGRFGGQAARVSASGSTAATKILPSTYTTLVAGFAVSTGNVTSARDLFIIKAGGTATFRVQVNASHFQVANSAGTVIAAGTTTISPSTWYYVEIKCFVNTGTPASGSCELHLNGVAEIASTLGNFGSAALDRINYTTGGISVNADFDDIYCLDTTGTTNNNFLGDVRVTTHFPTSDGAHSQWSPTGGGAHWSQVDDNPPDDDTTYVSDANPGDIDTYGLDHVDGGAVVFGVQTNLYARKDDANTRQIAPVIRQAGADHVGTTVTLASSYTFYSQLYDQDPTGSNWTATNFNSDEYGVKEIT